MTELIETVAAASAALLVGERLDALRPAPPAEVFRLLQRSISRSNRAHAEAMRGWGSGSSDQLTTGETEDAP